MSECVSGFGEFSYHNLIESTDSRDMVCDRCGHIEYAKDDSLISVPRDAFLTMMQQVNDMHRIMADIKTNLLPAVEQIQSGGIMSMLTGMRKR